MTNITILQKSTSVTISPWLALSQSNTILRVLKFEFCVYIKGILEDDKFNKKNVQSSSLSFFKILFLFFLRAHWYYD